MTTVTQHFTAWDAGTVTGQLSVSGVSGGPDAVIGTTDQATEVRLAAIGGVVASLHHSNVDTQTGPDDIVTVLASNVDGGGALIDESLPGVFLSFENRWDVTEDGPSSDDVVEINFIYVEAVTGNQIRGYHQAYTLGGSAAHVWRGDAKLLDTAGTGYGKLSFSPSPAARVTAGDAICMSTNGSIVGAVGITSTEIMQWDSGNLRIAGGGGGNWTTVTARIDALTCGVGTVATGGHVNGAPDLLLRMYWNSGNRRVIHGDIGIGGVILGDTNLLMVRCDSPFQFYVRTVAQLSGLTPTTGMVVYCSNGDAGNPCLVVYNGSAWKVVSLGATAGAT